MNAEHSLLLPVFGAVVLALSGCNGPPPPTRYYVLAPTQAPSAAPVAMDAPSVELSRVILPEYLNQAAILTKSRTNEVERAGYDQWAGPLSDEISRTIGENLAAAVPTDRLAVSSSRHLSPPDFSVEVEIMSFERDASNTVHLVARWSVYRENSPTLVAMRRSVYRLDAGGSDYASAVGAMSKALGDLSAEIADAIRKAGPAGRGAVEARGSRRF
jgi:uncharacterized lipoprotein YmbA